MNDEQQKNISDETKFSKLPDHVSSWLFSDEAAGNIREIAKNFNLEKEKIPILAKITGQVILKEILLEKFPLAIKQLLSLDEETSQKISIAVAIKEFLPIRDYLKDIEKVIISWGGILPGILPPIFQGERAPMLGTEESVSASVFKATIVQKSLRQIVQENKEVLSQTLTATPLKIIDFDQPVRGTIKNWLADYVRQKGAEKHNQMVRGDYLFKNDNAKDLPPQEKSLVAQILKSYDENSVLAYDEDKKIIILDNSASTTTVTNPTPVRQEPIEKKEGAAPPVKNAHPIDGRVINLKDLQ